MEDHARPGCVTSIFRSCEILRRIDDQLARLADASFDEYGQPTGSVGDDGAFLEDHDVEAGIDAPRARPPRSGPPRRLR